MKRLILFLLPCLIASLASHSWGQQMYRWVDEKGRVTYSDQPPPPKVVKFQEKQLKANLVEGEGLSYETQKAQKNFPVTLFVQPDCSACSSGRDYLAKRGIPFSEVSVKTPEDLNNYQQYFGKELQIPALLVGSQKTKGFEAGAWGQMLDLAGYPKSALPGSKPIAPAAPPAKSAP